MSESHLPALPVVVIGAGPQGLAAAAHLLERGQEPLVLEAGSGPAHAVREWGHVRLFSHWSELTDPAAARLLAPTGWAAPDARATRPARSGSSATSRRSPTRSATASGTAPRSSASPAAAGTAWSTPAATSSPSPSTSWPPTAAESRLDARAVIDASGTWTQPNPAGADGLPALGERQRAAGDIAYQVPDLERGRGRYAGKHTVVVGSGHSAFTALIELAQVAETNPGTTRSPGSCAAAWSAPPSAAAPPTSSRRAAPSASAAKPAVDDGLVDVVTGFRTEQSSAPTTASSSSPRTAARLPTRSTRSSS